MEEEDSYDTVTKEVDEAIGFRPIREFRGGNRGNLLIEAKFVNPPMRSQRAEKGCHTKEHNTLQHHRLMELKSTLLRST